MGTFLSHTCENEFALNYMWFAAVYNISIVYIYIL
jgi:hypothetical protein